MSKLSIIREHIKTLQAEQVSIVQQVNSRDAVRQTVRDGVRDCEPVSEGQTLQTLQRIAAGQPAPLLTVRAMTPHGPVTVDLLPVFIRLLGAEAVTEALSRGMDEIAVGLDTEARTARADTITDEIGRLGNTEEQLIRRSEASGEIIARRADAEARFVLALDTNL